MIAVGLQAQGRVVGRHGRRFDDDVIAIGMAPQAQDRRGQGRRQLMTGPGNDQLSVALRSIRIGHRVVSPFRSRRLASNVRPDLVDALL